MQGLLRDLLAECVKAMVMQPDDVSVREEYGEDTITYYISVAADDRGRVVGKQGAVIQGLRAIVKAANRTEHKMSVRVVGKDVLLRT